MQFLFSLRNASLLVVFGLVSSLQSGIGETLKTNTAFEIYGLSALQDYELRLAYPGHSETTAESHIVEKAGSFEIEDKKEFEISLTKTSEMVGEEIEVDFRADLEIEPPPWAVRAEVRTSSKVYALRSAYCKGWWPEKMPWAGSMWFAGTAGGIRIGFDRRTNENQNTPTRLKIKFFSKQSCDECEGCSASENTQSSPEIERNPASGVMTPSAPLPVGENCCSEHPLRVSWSTNSPSAATAVTAMDVNRVDYQNSTAIRIPSDFAQPLEQIKMGDVLGVVYKPSPTDPLKWRLYDATGIGARLGGGTGLYPLFKVDSSPLPLLEEVTVSEASGVVQLTRTKGGVTTGSHAMTFNSGTNSWEAENVTAGTKEKVTVTASGTGWLTATERYVKSLANAWVLVQSSSEKTGTFAGQERVVETSEGGDVTTSDYYTADGRLKSTLSPDGSWTFHTYSGYNETTYRPYGDTPKPWDGSGNWTPGSMAGIQSETRESDAVKRYIEGTLVSTVSHTFEPGPRPNYTETSVQDDGTFERRTVSTIAMGDLDDSLGGVPLLVDDGRGVVTACQYTTGEMVEQTVGPVTRNVFQASVGGSCLRTISTRGASTSLPTLPAVADGDIALLNTVGALVPGAETRDVEVTDSEGRVVYTGTEVLNSGTYEEATWTDTTYEENPGVADVVTVSSCGRVLSVTTTAADGSWEASVNEEGLTTTINRDAQGRTTSEVSPGPNGTITRSYAYDGLTTTVTTAGGGASLATSQTRDLRGRTVTSVDETGAITTYLYSYGGRETTVTGPGSVGITTKNYLDGRLKERSGSGVIREYVTYALIGSNEAITRSVGPGISGGHSSRWTKTTTGPDGRTVSVERPGFPSGPTTWHANGIDTYNYDSGTGELVSITSSAASGIYQRSEQNLLGTVSSSGTAFHTGAFVPSSSDRYSTTTSSYEKRSDYWWSVDTTRTYVGVSGSSYVETKSAHRLWNGSGEQSEVTDAAGVTTTVSSAYNPSAATKTVTTVDPRTGTSVETSVNGFLKTRTVPGASQAESFGYDGLGRQTTTTDVRNATTRTRYNGVGQIESVTDHLGQSVTYAHHPNNVSASGRVWKETDAAGKVKEMQYDSVGNVISIGGTGTYPVGYGYDGYGRQTSLTTYGTVTAVTTWVLDPPTGVLLEKKYQGDSTGIKYTYRADGKLASRIWKRGVTTEYGYNSQGDLDLIDQTDTAADPDVAFANFDRQGRATTVTEARNGGSDVTTLAYHPVTDAVTTTYGSHSLLSGLSVAMKTPDSSGRKKGYVLGNGTTLQDVEYGYDGYSRLGSIASGGLTASYSYYDGTSIPKVVTHTLASSVVPRIETRHVDLAGRTTGVVTTVPSGGGRAIAASAGYLYNSRGLREKLTREDATSWTYGYNDRSEVTSGVKKLANGNLAAGQQFGYEYDAIGNRISAQSGGDSSGNNLRTVSYTRNALNQYTAIATPGSFDVLVRSADTVGVTVGGAAATVTRQGNLHRALANVTNTTTGAWSSLSITSPAGTGIPQTGNRWVPKATTAPVYDADGNLTNDGRWDYVWDGENHLLSMTTLATGLPSGMPRKKLEFAYDWMSRRIAKKVSNWGGSSWTVAEERRFVYDGWNLVGEFKMVSGTRTLEKTYLWSLDLSGTLQEAGGVGGLLAVNAVYPSSSSCYPSYDGNGNITAWTSTAGDTLQRIDYDPFGNTLTRESASAFTPPAFGFSTKYQDSESGLCYYGYRYYDPVNGRWPSRDPIEETGGVNLYGMLNNNALSRVDRLGLKAEAYFSYIFGGHGWHTRRPNSNTVEKQMLEYESRIGWDLTWDRVSAVSCFNGNINSRFPNSIKSERDQFDNPSIKDYILDKLNPLPSGKPRIIWNPGEPGFLWIKAPVDVTGTPPQPGGPRRIHFEGIDWELSGEPEAYLLMEQKIKDAENQAEKDLNRRLTLGSEGLVCKYTVQVKCPTYINVAMEALDFNQVPAPPGKKRPCGYVNTVKHNKEGQLEWDRPKFNE